MIKKISFILALCTTILLTSCSTDPVDGLQKETVAETEIETADISNMDFAFSNRDNETAYTESGCTVIELSDSGIRVEGNGASLSDSGVTLSLEGTYIISGSATHARITVDAGETAKPQIILNGMSLTSADGPALFIKSADKVFLTLADGTENYLADGNSYELYDGDTTLDAALFSRADITINGAGNLTVIGNYKHGIVSKDDLIIAGGALKITAQNVGLSGKACVKITNADITIDAGTDGIRSDNTEDATRGYVYVESGTLHIAAGNDGIQAETVLNITGGAFDITTGGGSANASTPSGSYNPMWGMGGGPTSSTNEESAKGLKAASDILISGGTFTVDSSDDSIHANGTIRISDGQFQMQSGDDGIHADTDLAISGGMISINKSYEGLEASKIIISGGEIHVVAADDGLNAAGGNDGSSTSGRPGMDSFTRESGEILISGGSLTVNAAGDGIDSNGSLTVSGGVTYVSGPTDNGNGALDYNSSALVTGGVLIATGAAGMATGFTEAQNQGAILCSFNTQSGGSPLLICDEDGNVLASFTPSKSYQTAAISAPGIKDGGTYRLIVGADIIDSGDTYTGGTIIATITMNGLVYSSGGMGGMGPGGMGPGGMGGRPR